MKLINNTPFPVETMPLHGPENQPCQVVIAKATFDYASGEPALAKEQLPLLFGDELFDGADTRSVKFETDIVSFKPRTDVVVVGSAWAPGREPVASFEAGVRVGALSRTIRVFGKRVWEQESMFKRRLRASRPEPVKSVPLRYENAFGGMCGDGAGFCAANLLGKGYFSEKSKEIVGAELPALEDPDNLIASWEDKPEPVGFGFYARTGAARLEHLGTYDDEWRKSRSPELPEDFDFRFNNGAHPDLQVEGYLAGNEPVHLTNLTPDGDQEFNLPGVVPLCSFRKRDSESGNSAEMHLDTLCLIPEEGRFYAVWRATIPIADLTSMEIEEISVDA